MQLKHLGFSDRVVSLFLFQKTQLADILGFFWLLWEEID